MIYDITPIHSGIALTKHDHAVAFIKVLHTTAPKPKPLTPSEIEYMTITLAEALNAKAAGIALFKVGDPVLCGDSDVPGVIAHIRNAPSDRLVGSETNCVRVVHPQEPLSQWWAFKDLRHAPKVEAAEVTKPQPPLGQTIYIRTATDTFRIGDVVVCGNFKAAGTIGQFDTGNDERTTGVSPQNTVRVDAGTTHTWWEPSELQHITKALSARPAPAIDQTALRETQDALRALLTSIDMGVFSYEQRMKEQRDAAHTVLRKYAPAPPAEDPKWRKAAESKGWFKQDVDESAPGLIIHHVYALRYKTWEGCCRDQAIAVSDGEIVVEGQVTPEQHALFSHSSKALKSTSASTAGEIVATDTVPAAPTTFTITIPHDHPFPNGQFLDGVATVLTRFAGLCSKGHFINLATITLNNGSFASMRLEVPE